MKQRSPNAAAIALVKAALNNDVKTVFTIAREMSLRAHEAALRQFPIRNYE